MHTQRFRTKPSIRFLSRIIAVAVGLFVSSLAFAHTGHDHAEGLYFGIAHPIGGLDHLLAMLGVGIWAAQIGGKSRFVLPLAFVGVMLLGGALGMTGMNLPYIEEGILGSVMVLGLLLSLAFNVPLLAGALIVGFFAIFHGYAHGAEMPISSGALAYMFGFALSTALLHIAGVFGVNAIKDQARLIATRISGLVLMLAGAYLAIV